MSDDQAPERRAWEDGDDPASHSDRRHGGRLSLECARQAIIDQQATTGIAADLIAADHRNSPDLGVSIARQWISEGVDAIMEFNNSAVALGVNTLIRDAGRVVSNVLPFEVKSPAQSKGEWDLYQPVATLGPERALRPMSEGGCPLVRT